MKLYLLTSSGPDGYDTYDSCVVAAPDAEAARRTHPSDYPSSSYVWGEKENSWMRKNAKVPTPKSRYCDDWAHHIDQVHVIYLGEAAQDIESGVICASFNAG